MKTPTIILEVRGGNIQMIGSTTNDVNIIIVDHDNIECVDKDAAIEYLQNYLSNWQPDTVEANHKLLVDSMFSECHDETDQAIYDRLIQLGEQTEANP
jgi:hypothetical protein